jgi:hypothetical protein
MHKDGVPNVHVGIQGAAGTMTSSRHCVPIQAPTEGTELNYTAHQKEVKGRPNIVAEWLSNQLRILEVQFSNLSPDTSFPDRFSFVFLNPPATNGIQR